MNGLEAYLHREQERVEQESAGERERPFSLDSLVRNGEWMRLKENEEYQEMSIQGRIIKATEAVSNRIKQSEKMFAQVLVRNPHGAGTILQQELKPLRNLKEALGERYVGVFKNEDAEQETVGAVLGIPSPLAEERGKVLQFKPKTHSPQRKAA